MRGLVTQISHASLLAEPIVNWTRTVDDATRRHAQSEADSGAKTSAKDDKVAALVEAKLEHLQMLDGTKVKPE